MLKDLGRERTPAAPAAPAPQEAGRGAPAGMKTATLNAMPAYVARLDLRGNIVATNEAWSRLGLTGADEEGWAASGNYFLLCETAPGHLGGKGDHVARGVRAVLAGDLPEFSTEYPCPHRSRWFRLIVTPMRRGGQLEGAAVMHLNITQQKRVEQDLLKAKEEAEAANRAKSEFLANISHEVRTPLNGILGMTRVALDTDLTDQQREHLRLVELSAESMLAVLNEILDFAKIEAHKLSLDPDNFDLRPALDGALRVLAVRARAKGLASSLEIDPDVPDFLFGDALRLRQVLVNLVGNAVKFTERGEIAVRVRLQETTAEWARLHFAVRDTGVGVPPEKHAAIFQPFVQADGSTTRKYGGTGLGLAIASQLVGMMGGRIWVESEVGRGSTFHFTAVFGRGEAG